MSTACSNHTCINKFEPKETTCYSCSLCATPLYCSEACRVMDWPLHACENLIETKTPQLAFAVPYYYEDTLSAKELATIPISDPIFHSHSVRYVNSNREMIQSTIPSLIEYNATSHDEGGSKVARGINPKKIPNLDAFKTFSIEISIAREKHTVEGFIPYNMIFQENEANPRAQELSGGGSNWMERTKNVLKGGARRAFSKQSTSLVFWPSPEEVQKLDFSQLPLRDDFSIQLNLTAGKKVIPISSVTGGYSLSKQSSGWLGKTDRKVQQAFNRQLELKFKSNNGKGTTLATKNLSVHRYSDFDGNTVMLTFSVTPGATTATLVDVEYIVDSQKFKRDFTGDLEGMPSAEKSAVENTLSEIMSDDESSEDTRPTPPARDDAQISSRFTCDPRNFDEVGGLVMALDFITSTATPDMDRDTLKNLESASSVIKKYANLMQTNDGVAPDKIPSEVHVAIQTGLDTLFEPIEMSGDQNYWRKKMNKTFENMCADVVPIIVAAQKARQGNPKVKVFRSLKTGIYNKKLNTISTVLTAHISSLKANDVPAARIAKYQELLDAVTSTLRGEDVNTSALCSKTGITVQSTTEEQ